jgi:hypothetical protein
MERQVSHISERHCLYKGREGVPVQGRVRVNTLALAGERGSLRLIHRLVLWGLFVLIFHVEHGHSPRIPHQHTARVQGGKGGGEDGRTEGEAMKESESSGASSIYKTSCMIQPRLH